MSKWGAMLAVALCGGTTYTSCQTRLRDNLVGGTTVWINSLLDPSLYLDALLASITDTNTGQQ